jgi:Zn-dependent protease with chaperone function
LWSRRVVAVADHQRPWLRARTVAGEQRYQRVLVLALATILVLSLAPIVGTHVLGVADRPLSGSDHIGALCLIALHELLAPAHRVLHLLVGGGFAWALWELARNTLRTRRVLDGLPVRRLRGAETQYATACRLSAKSVLVVSGLPIPAFTAGPWLRPRVYLAESLLVGAHALPAAELFAVLKHEATHVRRRDPLRFVLLRGLARALFWIPALRAIAEDIADEAEIIADDAATATAGPVAVASALVKLGSWTSPSADRAVVGFVRPDLLNRRVRRLLGEDYQPQSRLTRRSVLAAAVVLVVSVLSGIVDVHDLPTSALHPSSHRHCEHDGTFATAHLFCRWGVSGPLLPVGAADCPHAGV